MFGLNRFLQTRDMRAPDARETASIISAVNHIPTPALAEIADPSLKGLVRASLDADGVMGMRGILQIGLATADLEIEEDRFRARCDVRLTTPGSRLEVLIEGDIDMLGRVTPRCATLLADLSLRAA